MQVDIATHSPTDEGTGHWTEWREDSQNGSTITFANTKMRRVGYCQGTTFDNFTTIDLKTLLSFDTDFRSNLLVQVDELSRKIEPRILQNGQSALSPLDRNQLQLPSIREPLQKLLSVELESIN